MALEWSIRLSVLTSVYLLEPGIYAPGVGGARHSDTVLVTATGYELLTA